MEIGRRFLDPGCGKDENRRQDAKQNMLSRSAGDFVRIRPASALKSEGLRLGTGALLDRGDY